jgi:hypothetical protein
MFYLFVGVFVVLFTIFCVKQAGKNEKVRDDFQNLQKMDERFLSSKLFDFINTSFILVSETGFIALKSLAMEEIKVLSIKDIIGFEVVTNGKAVANIGGAIAGGLLFGGVGAIIGGSPSREKISSMSFLFKTNDFNNPNIEIPVIALSIKNGSYEYQAIEEKLKNLTSILEIVEKKIKGQ